MTKKENKVVLYGTQISLNDFHETRKDKTVCLAHGTYDLFHYGHLRHLKAAAEQGDILIVSITSDNYINKGPGRPIFDQSQRAEILQSLNFVDYVAIVDAPAALEVIEILKPDVYVKGAEYRNAENDPTGMIVKELEAVAKIGGKVWFSDEVVYSSSSLINSELQLHGEVAYTKQLYLSQTGIKEDIFNCIDQLSDLNVCIIGETIVDTYVSCEALGKVNKDPILAFVPERFESHAGGVFAIALHLATLVNYVTIITQDNVVDLDCINLKDFPQNVHIEYVGDLLKDPRIEKKRYVDSHTSAKVFETYSQKELSYHDGYSSEGLIKILENIDQNFDAVLIADYGHGLLNKSFAKKVASYPGHIAVNVQANAGNRGFNFISKYPVASFVSLAEHELRLEMRDNTTYTPKLLNTLAEKFPDWETIYLTAGKNGSYVFSKNTGQIVSCPAFANKIVDRVGAGDAVFALASLVSMVCKNSEIVTFLGNVIGGLVVSYQGNEKSISSTVLKKAADSLLKV